MRLVDLGVPIVPHPQDTNVGEIERWTHDRGPERLGRAFAGFLEGVATRNQLDSVPALDADAFPDGMFLSNEIIRLAVHGGTHLDAPYHYGPTCEGRPAKRIDEVPLAWCLGPGVRLTFTDKAPLELITSADVERELARIGHAIAPGDIVLIHTGWDARWPDPAYFDRHPAMSLEATKLLVQRGVRVIGVDTNGFDLPPTAMVEAYALSGDSAHLWPCHMYGREVEYLQIERMGGLGRLPAAHGFTVACFPICVDGAGAGWVRPVAMIDDERKGAAST
jgi:kynurenine formamidase